MTNFKAAKVEKSIYRIIDKMNQAKDERKYNLVEERKKVFLALVEKWETIKGSKVIENPFIYNKIIDRMYR